MTSMWKSEENSLSPPRRSWGSTQFVMLSQLAGPLRTKVKTPCGFLPTVYVCWSYFFNHHLCYAFHAKLRNMKYFLIVVELTLNEPVCLNLVTALSQRESLKSTCCTDDSPLRLWVGRASFRTFKVSVCTYLFLFKRLGRGCLQLLGRVLCRYDTRCYHLHHQEKINKIKVAQTGRSAWNLTQPHGERVTIRKGIAQRGHLK